MINYKKSITISKQKNGEWFINSDKNDRYECFSIANTSTPWTKWWEMQNQSELRLWQKDIMRDFAARWDDLTPYVIYKRNHGYNQPHDMMISHSEEQKIWIFSTQDDFWITKTEYGEFQLSKIDSLGSVLKYEHRQEIYKVLDNLK